MKGRRQGQATANWRTGRGIIEVPWRRRRRRRKGHSGGQWRWQRDEGRAVGGAPIHRLRDGRLYCRLYCRLARLVEPGGEGVSERVEAGWGLRGVASVNPGGSVSGRPMPANMSCVQRPCGRRMEGVSTLPHLSLKHRPCEHWVEGVPTLGPALPHLSLKQGSTSCSSCDSKTTSRPPAGDSSQQRSGGAGW